MSDSIHFELVSPERLLMDIAAASVVVPGSEGDFTVLPGHAPVMSTIRPGVVEVMETGGGEPSRLFVRGGFAEVTSEGLVILAEEVIVLADVSREELQQKVADAGEDVEDARTDEEKRLAIEALARLTELAEAKS
ncbi:MAG: F0F1 ATP synthase subunit epsilon [Proteobacteria bacterium]|nr:F0F1 ATP synthase subunit epsilon [Pseudomonadota bacterium]